MECMRDIVLKELSNAPVGSNTDCAYYPCHHEGQDCTFCYCPFYPCNDVEVGGKEVMSKKGEPVWSCMGCHFVHSKEVSEYIHHRLRLTGFDENTDLDSLFKDIKEIFFYPERERWINLQNL